MSGAHRTAAVVVTYDPEPARFDALIGSIAAQVHAIFVVDNGSTPHAQRRVHESLERHCTGLGRAVARFEAQGSNLGIAAAQNHGIRAAFDEDHTHVLLLDHDSIPAAGMVGTLHRAMRELERDGVQIAAVGPRYVDARQHNPPPFIRVRHGRLVRLNCPDEDCVQPVDYLVASGSLMPRRALERTGLMNESLFIDYVDIEWGLRAGARGLRSFGVCGAHMDHTLGDAPLVLFGRRIPLHSAFRHYFLFRNALLLYRRPDIPWSWKIVDARRLVLRLAVYGLFARPRRAQWRAMTRGLWHGLLDRGGADGSVRHASQRGPDPRREAGG